MEFVLRYKGPLTRNAKAADKQLVRDCFHAQLEQLCGRYEFWNRATATDLPELSMQQIHHLAKVGIGDARPFFTHAVNGWSFLPLINEGMRQTCDLSILWLRHDPLLGGFVHGGDLDRRLVALFDGLRMPSEKSEVPKRPARDGQRCYCLLSDDKLISGLEIRTYPLLTPEVGNHEDADVELWIHVTTRPIEPWSAGAQIL